jgi:hypothetical protein
LAERFGKAHTISCYSPWYYLGTFGRIALIAIIVLLVVALKKRLP